MHDFTLQPWMWWGLGLALTAGALYAAAWYLETRPLTDTDLYCAAVDNELNARHVPWTANIDANLAEHAPFDTSDFDDAVAEAGQVLCEETEAWLRSREPEGAS